MARLQRFKKFEPHLWALIIFCLGVTFQSALSYIFVEVHPLTERQAELLLNEDLAKLEDTSPTPVKHVAFQSNWHCKLAGKNTIEKFCRVEFDVIFMDDTYSTGVCTTGSYALPKCFIDNFNSRQVHGVLAFLEEK